MHTQKIDEISQNEYEDVVKAKISLGPSYTLESAAVFLIIALLLGLFIFIYYFLRER